MVAQADQAAAQRAAEIREAVKVFTTKLQRASSNFSSAQPAKGRAAIRIAIGGMIELIATETRGISA